MYKRQVITFGLGSYADIYCENLEYVNGVGHFDLMRDGEKLTHVELSVPGKHNVKNALAAAAAALTIGVPPTAIAAGLHAYRGADVYKRQGHRGPGWAGRTSGWPAAWPHQTGRWESGPPWAR